MCLQEHAYAFAHESPGGSYRCRRGRSSRVERFIVPKFLLIGLTLFSVSHASPAFAQQTGPFVAGLAGGAFSNQRSVLFGGRAGVPVGGGLFAIGEIGRALDVMPADIASELGIVSRLIELQTGTTASLDASVPAFYGWGGARWMPRTGRVTSFVEGGLGFARLTLNIDRVAGGTDSSEDLRRDLADENIESTRLLLLGGGGISVALGSAWSADIGYRYNRIFADDPQIGLNTVYTSILYHF